MCDTCNEIINTRKSVKIEKYTFDDMYMDTHVDITQEGHLKMIEKYAYLVANKEMKLKESYILLYIKMKPKYIPDFVYKWFISRFIVLCEFH